MQRQQLTILLTLFFVSTHAYAIQCPKAASFHHPAVGQPWQLDANDQSLWNVAGNPKSDNDSATSMQPTTPVNFIFIGDSYFNKYNVVCSYSIGTDVAPITLSVFNKNVYTAPTSADFLNLGGNYKCSTVASATEKCESGSNSIYHPAANALYGEVKNAPTSTMHLSLGEGWATKSRYEKGIENLRESYTKMIPTLQRLKVTTHYDIDDTEINTKQMYDADRQFESNANITITDMPTSANSANNDSFQKYGFYWVDAKSQKYGFNVYILGDAHTIYSFEYDSNGAEQKDQMDTILKSIQICHKDNTCITANQ